MKRSLFRQFSGIAYEKAGIYLREGKEALVSARISKRQRALNVASPEKYLKYIQEDDSGQELWHFLDAIATNYTNFFRERSHFSYLADEVRDRVDQGQRRLRFWSAACATGEEPVTMAITILEQLGDQPVDAKILATDISTAALQRAAKGEYSEAAMKSVPKIYRLKHFERLGSRSQGEKTYRLKKGIREMIVYKRLNLAQPPFPMKGPLDMIFCRNVMIYFDQTVRQGLITAAEKLLRPEGLLAIGHSETLTGLTSSLKTAETSIYVKR